MRCRRVQLLPARSCVASPKLGEDLHKGRCSRGLLTMPHRHCRPHGQAGLISASSRPRPTSAIPQAPPPRTGGPTIGASRGGRPGSPMADQGQFKRRREPEKISWALS